MPANRGKWRIVREINEHPIIVAVVGTATIVGTLLTVYVYMYGEALPDLYCLVSPTATVVVRQGEVAGLKLSHEGKDVEEDITAIQVAVWNAGKAPIRRGDILEPIRLRLRARRIIEASVRHETRSVVRMAPEVIHGEDDLGDIVEVSFEILEKGDGGIIQIVCFGDESVDVEASGIVVGQPQLKQSNAWKGWKPDIRPRNVPIVFVFLLIFIAVFNILKEIRDLLRVVRKRGPGRERLTTVLITLCLIGVFVVALWLGMFGDRNTDPLPPFPF